MLLAARSGLCAAAMLCPCVEAVVGAGSVVMVKDIRSCGEMLLPRIVRISWGLWSLLRLAVTVWSFSLVPQRVQYYRLLHATVPVSNAPWSFLRIHTVTQLRG